MKRHPYHTQRQDRSSRRKILGGWLVASATVTAITAALSAVPASLPPSSYFTTTAEVGSINVSASVTAHGTASASIPISVPPGRAGMAPELSVNYTGSGAGMLGVGFKLDGIPYMERCDIDTVHPERFAEGMVDVCLGGDRLILVEGEHMQPGARYRVRSTPTTLVEFVGSIGGDGDPGNPGEPTPAPGQEVPVPPPNVTGDHFLVRYGDGRLGRFGGREHTEHAGRWHISELSDPFDNRIVYQYDAFDNGPEGSNLLPTRIEYTLNDEEAAATRLVRFFYEQLPASEQYTVYTRHGDHRVSRRLISIESQVWSLFHWRIASSYEFAYTNATDTGRSLLQSVTRCDHDGACLPPVQFDWHTESIGYQVRNLNHQATSAAPSKADLKYSVAADFDRDGRDEIAYVRKVHGRDAPAPWLIWDPEAGAQITSATARVVLDREETAFSGRNAALAPQVADFNGDGSPDIVSPYCATTSGRGCLDETVRDLDYYPYATQFAFNMGAGAPAYLYSTGSPGMDTSQVPSIEVSNLRRGGERIFISQVGEIDGDGHPDLYICAGENAADAWWSLALNRIHEPGSPDFRVVNTWRRCFAWDLYQVFDSNGNGLDELHVVEGTPEGSYRYNAIAAKNLEYMADPLPPDPVDIPIVYGAGSNYVALEFPRYEPNGQPISVEEAITRLSPPTPEAALASPHLDLSTSGNRPTGNGWSRYHSWPSIPLDLGTRSLYACAKPDEVEEFVVDKGRFLSFLSSNKLTGPMIDALLHAMQDVDVADWLRAHGDGMTAFQEILSYHEPANALYAGNIAPFIAPGPSSDIKTDINGDGLTDVIRLLPVPVGGTVDDSYEGAIVFDAPKIEDGGLTAPACKMSEKFDYKYAYYINRGGSLKLAGSSPTVLSSQLPWLAASVLSATIVSDVNGDGRPDLTVPDYAAYAADKKNTSSWRTYITMPNLQDYIVETDLLDMPYDLGAEVDPETGQLPYDTEDRYHGPIWFNLGLGTSLGATAFQAYLEELSLYPREQAISGGIHLNDRLNNDLIVFGPITRPGLPLVAYEQIAEDPVDHLQRVTDGLGEVKGEFEYTHSRTVPGITTGPNTAPGRLTKTAPARIVTRFQSDAGLPDPASRRWIDFEYRNGRGDRMGGFLGYQRVIRRYSASGALEYRVERTRFDQYTDYDAANKLYPFAGMATDIVSQQKAFDSGGSPVRLVSWSHAEPAMLATNHPSVVSTYTPISHGATFEIPDYFCGGEICNTDDLDDLDDPYQLTRTDTAILDIDAFGNVVESETVSADGSASHVVRGVTNLVNIIDDESLWRMGLLDSEVNTVTGPDGQVRVLTTGYDWNPETGTRTSETREPDSTDPDIHLHTEWFRDERGNLIETRISDLDGEVRSTFTEWDELGYFPVETTNASGWGSRQWFEPYFGNLIGSQGPNSDAIARACIDGLGRSTCARTTYGHFGDDIGEELTHEIVAASPVEAQAFNGAYTRVTYRNGVEIARNVHDRKTRVTARIYPVLNENSPDHPDRYVVMTTYNGLGLATSESVPLLYDETDGEPQVLLSQRTRYVYDTAQRRIDTLPSGDRGTIEVGYSKRGARITDADGKTSYGRMSASRHPVYTEDAAGVGTCYYYGPFNAIKRITRNCHDGDELNMSPVGGELDTTFQYDAIGRRVAITTPESGTSTIAYNAFGQIRQTVDALGHVTTWAFDDLGRVGSRTALTAGGEQEHQATWQYDVGPNALGMLSSTHIEYGPEQPVVHKHFTFDSWGRPKSTTLEVLGNTLHQEVDYNEQNQLAQTRYNIAQLVFNPDGSTDPFYTVTYGYDTDLHDHGFLRRIGTQATAERFFRERVHDGWGNAVEGLYGDGSTRSVMVDPWTGRTESVSSQNAVGALVSAWRYQWTADGDLAWRTDVVEGQTECYRYDDRHWLVGVDNAVVGNCDGVTTERLNIGYDDYGRITHKSTTPGTGLYSYEPGTGRLEMAGSYSLNFDDKGQLIYRWNQQSNMITELGWYSFNKVRQMNTTADGNPVRFYYDADGALAARVEGEQTRTSIYLGAQTRSVSASGDEDRITIGSTSGSVAEVSIKPPLLPDTLNEEVTFLHNDLHGSPTAVVNSTGVSQRRFDPFGRRTDLPNIETSGVRADSITVGFTGHESETAYDLINMRARYFDPVLANFVQADTIIPNPMRGIDWNRYAYVRNNPFRYTDPTGHAAQCTGESASISCGAGQSDGEWLEGSTQDEFDEANKKLSGFDVGHLGRLDDPTVIRHPNGNGMGLAPEDGDNAGTGREQGSPSEPPVDAADATEIDSNGKIITCHPDDDFCRVAKEAQIQGEQIGSAAKEEEIERLRRKIDESDRKDEKTESSSGGKFSLPVLVSDGSVELDVRPSHQVNADGTFDVNVSDPKTIVEAHVSSKSSIRSIVDTMRKDMDTYGPMPIIISPLFGMPIAKAMDDYVSFGCGPYGCDAMNARMKGWSLEHLGQYSPYFVGPPAPAVAPTCQIAGPVCGEQ